MKRPWIPPPLKTSFFGNVPISSTSWRSCYSKGKSNGRKIPSVNHEILQERRFFSDHSWGLRGDFIGTYVVKSDLWVKLFLRHFTGLHRLRLVAIWGVYSKNRKSYDYWLRFLLLCIDQCMTRSITTHVIFIRRQGNLPRTFDKRYLGILILTKILYETSRNLTSLGNWKLDFGNCILT